MSATFSDSVETDTDRAEAGVEAGQGAVACALVVVPAHTKSNSIAHVNIRLKATTIALLP